MRRLLRALAALACLGAACRRAEAPAVVAKVGKAVITESEFGRRLEQVAPDYQNYVLTPHGRRQFLDVLIREELILQAARADGIEAAPEFKDRLRRLRVEEERKLAEARDYMLKRLWLDKLREQGVLKVGDADVEDYHKKHPIEVQARHALLPTPEDALAVLRRIQAGGSFEAEARKHSLDADTAAQGGRMNPMLFGEVIPELRDVYKMRVGEVAGPVRSKFGYHVILKESERPAPLEAVKDRIREILEKDRLDQHLQSLQAAYPVEVVDAQFK